MNNTKISKLIVRCMMLCFMSTFAQENVIYQLNFNQLATGQYDRDQIKEALDVSFCKGADEGRVFISEFQNKGNVLKVKYPKGKVKTNDSGMHTKKFWNNYESFDELYFSYNVYIPEDFEFRAGAKLPGLAYQTRHRNMSLRLMWRYDGLLEFYNHFETRPSWQDWTASVNWSLLDPYDEPGGPQLDQVRLKKGAWNHIEVYHKLNAAGQNDGIMRGWLNGQLAIDIIDNGDYRQSGEEDIQLNSIYLSTFFGGSRDDFKPTKDQYAYFDDFVVSKTRIGYDEDVDEGEDEDETLSVDFITPSTNLTLQDGYDLEVEVNAVDDQGSITDVSLYINDSFIRKERVAPYTWGHMGSPNPEEVNGLAPGTYEIKAVATNNLGETTEAIFALTVASNMDCDFVFPDDQGIPGLDNQYYEYVHVMGSDNPNFLNNFVNFSVKWSPIYNQLSKFALLTNNGSPDWYVDLSKTAKFQLKNPNPEITLVNTGFEDLDGRYWVSIRNEELVLRSQNNATLICFSNNEQPPLCMQGKSQKTTSINNSQKLTLYPNPANEVLFIHDVPVSTDQIRVINLNGAVIFSKSAVVKQSKLKVSLDQLPAGLYFLELISNNRRVLKTKFVKQ